MRRSLIDVLSFDKKPRKKHRSNGKLSFKNDARMIFLMNITLVIGKGFDSNSMGGKKKKSN